MTLQIFMALESDTSLFATPGPLLTDALLVTGLLAAPGPPIHLTRSYGRDVESVTRYRRDVESVTRSSTAMSAHWRAR